MSSEKCVVCDKQDDKVIYIGHYKIKDLGFDRVYFFGHVKCVDQKYPQLNISNHTKRFNILPETIDHFYRSEYGSSEDD